MFGTVTSAELKTRTLTSFPDGCAACTVATEIQDKIRRRLIWVLIFSPYPNLKLSIQKETRVEGRVSRGNRSSRDTRPSSLDSITCRHRNSGPSSVVVAAEPFLPLLQS